MIKKIFEHAYYAAVLIFIPFVLYSLALLFWGEWIWSIALSVIGFMAVFGATKIGINWPQWKKIWYIINAIPLVILTWATYDYFTCTGKLCQITGIFVGLGSVILMILLWLCYVLARFGHKHHSIRIIYLIICVIVITYSLLFLSGEMLNI